MSLVTLHAAGQNVARRAPLQLEAVAQPTGVLHEVRKVLPAASRGPCESLQLGRALNFNSILMRQNIDKWERGQGSRCHRLTGRVSPAMILGGPTRGRINSVFVIALKHPLDTVSVDTPQNLTFTFNILRNGAISYKCFTFSESHPSQSPLGGLEAYY